MSVEVLKNIWPEWQIEEKPIGKGSFSEVYKAVRRDHGIESYAAIKEISIPSNQSEIDSLRAEGLDINSTRTYLKGIVNDFVSEIQLMESLKGMQNIVSVEDYKVVEKKEEVGWNIYIRMELLTPFNSYICNKKLTEKDIIKLGCDICTALEVCAKRNIIHRDIKPENIFVNDFGYFKLGDFGIARKMVNITNGLSQKGTFNYIAPEVANSREYDARVDIYSLGIVLYRLLNGNRLPFLDTQPQILDLNERGNAVSRRLNGEILPAPCDASPAMSDIILRACAYEPDMRFSSATEMKNALMSVANGTYKISEGDLDRTKSVHRVAASNVTTSDVNKKAVEPEQKSVRDVNSFDSKAKKRRKATTKIVVGVFFLIILGIFIIPKVINRNDKTSNEETIDPTVLETNDESKSDEEIIASLISEADALAAEGDYEGARAKVATGLVTYPDSIKLQNKKNEYTKSMNAQIKDKALVEAKALADSGDYINAVKTIKNAIAVVGDDKDLSEKTTECENAYVAGIVEQANSLLADGEFDLAEALVNNAKEQFPKNESLIGETEKIKNARPVYLLDEVKPYKKPFWYGDNAMFKMGGKTYTHGFTCMGYGDDPVGNQTYFNLDGKYSSMSLTAGIVEDRGRTVEITFYADGELIYSITMNSGDLPTQHAFSVEGCRQLVICVYDKKWVAEGSGTYGLADILVKKITTESNTVQGGLKDGESYFLNVVEPYKKPFWYKNSSAINMGGKTYSHGFTCMGYGDNPVGNQTYFNLDGKYSSMSLTAGIVEDCERSVYITFYADGELIYRITMNSGELPTEHSFSIKGCKQLMISVYDGKWVANGSGTYGLAEITVN